ncbi:glycosyltransferase [Amylibacter sp.]|nr:glycosyltransferase [Amylibacter sp.]
MDKLKVAIVSTEDTGGGFWAANRLHNGLRCADIDSRMFVLKKNTDDKFVVVDQKFGRKFINRVLRFLDGAPARIYRKRRRNLFSAGFIGSRNLISTINKFNPDVVHIHWISGGAIAMSGLKHIKAPIIWSHHDMWAFTGGCHYSNGCNYYQNSCGSCPTLNSRNKFDLSSLILLKKISTISELKSLTNVGLSNWMLDCLQKSSIMRHTQSARLPNPIDTNVFKHRDPIKSRKRLGLPLGKKLILFGAMSATKDARKGFQELCQALNQLKPSNNIEVVIMGGDEDDTAPSFPFTATYTGFVSDWDKIIDLYSAADLMVVPSLEENLSNAIMESLSCSTPVVCFDIGGNPDLVVHKVNGYLAKESNVEDLANGISWTLKNMGTNLSRNAREHVMQNFEQSKVSKKYINLYKSVIENG